MGILRKIFVLSMVMLFYVACTTPEAPKTDIPDQYYDVQAQDTNLTDTLGGQGSFSPDGQWASIRVTAQCIVVPGFKKAFEMLHYSLNLGQMKADSSGKKITIQYKTCFMTDTPMLGLATTYPEPVVKSINPWSVTAFIERGTDGFIYQESPRIEKWGIKIDPFKEDFPTSKDDKRIWDQDKDKKLGVTLIMGNNFCKLYLAQYTLRQFGGEIKNSAEIKGTGISFGEKMILGATNSFCAPKNKVFPYRDDTYFKMIRVDGKNGGVDLDENHDGKVDCKELMDNWKKLFKQPKPDDTHCAWVLGGKKK